MASIPGYLLRRSQRVHNAIWAEELGSEITSPQYAVLAALAAGRAVDQHELGQLTSLDKSSVADVVDRLVSRSWIQVTRDIQDARRKILSLDTKAGLALDDLTPAVERVQNLLLTPLEGETRKTEFLEQLRRAARFGSFPIEPSPKPRPWVLDLDAPGHLIRCAQQVHTALWGEEFGRQITGPQYAALHVLAQHDQLSQRQLGHLAALDKSTAADIVGRLARRDLVQSEVNPADGRVRVIALTPTAMSAMPALGIRVAKVQSRLIEPIEAKLRENFISGLALIAFEGELVS